MGTVRVAGHAGNFAVHSASDDAPLHLVAEVQASRDDEVAELQPTFRTAKEEAEGDRQAKPQRAVTCAPTYAIGDEVESVREDTIDDLRSACRIVAVLELLLEEDAGLLVVAVEDEANDGLTDARNNDDPESAQSETGKPNLQKGVLQIPDSRPELGPVAAVGSWVVHLAVGRLAQNISASY